MQKLPIRIKEHLREIPFFVGRDLWAALAAYLQTDFPAHSLFVIADSTVAALYGEAAAGALRPHGGFRDILTFPAGEQYKSRARKEQLEDLLLLGKAGRDSVIVALGGGVTGDLAGYLAATLHRGVPLVHLPTSLMAQVDSSIGGKVGVNHPAGKNLIGAFYQPRAVFCDTAFLKTLPEEEFFNGMAEVIKYAVILDDELWRRLDSESAPILRREPGLLEQIVLRCASLKIKVVEADEKESGYRSILNFGHTAGHAIEHLSEYRIKHGFAVAEGMRIAARLSHQLLGYPRERVEDLDKLLELYGLKGVGREQFSAEEIWNCICSDKKARRQAPRFTLLRSPHHPELFYPVEKQELSHALAAS
ncbi:MAG: 3-dehydroquinate synthase [Calditrichaceae bacterium]|nr:3-dehydroquinate synthase [Calditrichia bacterium]NUQ41980.1 3-dehydroquinate synthase [Calditrichaceae bacterium]